MGVMGHAAANREHALKCIIVHRYRTCCTREQHSLYSKGHKPADLADHESHLWEHYADYVRVTIEAQRCHHGLAGANPSYSVLKNMHWGASSSSLVH